MTTKKPAPAPKQYETLYILTAEDAYAVADEMGVTITDDDMQSIRKGLEWGLECWHDVMQAAIENAVDAHE